MEPTNNAAERALRCAAQWRKTSFGSRSTRGETAVARLLTVTRTCRPQVSILQTEFSLTQVLDGPVTGRVFFEEVIRENLDIGRPGQVQLIFDRRVSKKNNLHSGCCGHESGCDSADVAIFDVATRKEVKRVPVGRSLK